MNRPVLDAVRRERKTIGFVAARDCSYQPLIVKSFEIESCAAVSIGDIGNELFSESPRGARSLSIRSNRKAPQALWFDAYCTFCVVRHVFVRLHRHRWEIMSPLDSTARKQAPEPASAFRMAPHNIEAEQALLGAILVNNEALYRVSDFLEPFHFFEPIHQQIYDHARSLVRTGKLASPITLKTFLPADIDIAGLTVAQYLARLAAEATTIINAADYGRAVYDLAIRRDLIGIGEDMVNVAFDAPVDFAPRDQIEDAERRLYELAEIGRYGGGFQRFESALTTALEMAAHAYQREGKLSGLATELKDLDSKAALSASSRSKCRPSSSPPASSPSRPAFPPARSGAAASTSAASTSSRT
jgi:hypothetical protein